VALVIAGMALFQALCGAAGGLMTLVGYTRPMDDGAIGVMFLSAAISAAAAAAGWYYGREEAGRKLSRRDATLAVALIWFGAGVFGGLPFVLGARMTPADAFFEAVSGFTTTGATILSDIEGTLSRPLVLWRSIIQWLGGMGIVVLFVAVFSSLGIGGKHMFRSEVPGPTAEGLQPRITETSLTLWGLYTGMTAVLALVLAGIGWATPSRPGVPDMDLFQAVCHALTTMSTGGFSPMNASVGAFDSWLIEGVLSVAMLVAGVNFALYYTALRQGSLRAFARSTEFQVYVVVVLTMIVLLTFAILDNHDDSLAEAFRYALFMVATTITSTGFGTDDYMAYNSTALMLVLLMMFIGGMAGSTAGGIKISRIVILAKTSWLQIRLAVRPAVVQTVKMDRRSMPPQVLTDVAVFFFVYMAFMAIGTMLVSITDGVPVQTAFGAMLTTLSNMGPAPFYVGTDNFASYSDVAKVWFSFAMILGRLEFFTLLALLLPDFWRR
jgi:trk system potassium uptake protein TrkH